MSNKKMHLILWLVLAIFVGVIWSFTSAVSFTIEFWSYSKPESWGSIRQNMVPIHFKDNWNDFHWFMYFSDGIVESSWWVNQTYLVKVAGSAPFECHKKVKGFYYNAERGERLWPLDGEYGGIIASGWLYTRCTKEGYSRALSGCVWGEAEREACEKSVEEEYVDSHGYYWMVTHNYHWQTIALVAWTDYVVNPWEKWMTIWSKLAHTFVRFANQYPVWFIYDGNWWAGFVWCEIRDEGGAQALLNEFNASLLEYEDDNGWEHLFGKRGNGIEFINSSLDCSNEWTAMNSLIKVVVDGLVWINNSSDNKGIQWNQSNAKMQYFSSVSVNNMQLINYAKQRAEILCRWKWDVYDSDSDIVCVSSDAVDPIDAPLNKTLIVKWWASVKIKDTNKNNYDDGKYYDVFVDGWNLLIQPEAPELTVFKNNWFKSERSLSDFQADVSAIRSAGFDYSGVDVAAWRFIKWNFIVNWNIKPAYPMTGLENVYFIYWKMTSKDTVDKLEEVFVWRCNVWSGSDWTPCPWWWKASDGTTWSNPYQNASLVIIDQNYPSPLYK